MNISFFKFPAVLVFLVILIYSCNSKPKVVESTETSSEEYNTPIFNESENLTPQEKMNHEVTVQEVLNTDKYSYLRVTEDGEEFWIAITKQEINIGEVYYYSNGLMKKNFYSREFDRVFDTVFLVSSLWQSSKDHVHNSDDGEQEGHHPGEHIDMKVGKIDRAEGAIPIATLIADKDKYNGELVTVTGKCVKVNPMIMHRNWVHLKDSDSDGSELVVTTTDNIPLGGIVTLEGILGIDRDFGAGYRYDVIMESATIK